MPSRAQKIFSVNCTLVFHDAHHQRFRLLDELDDDDVSVVCCAQYCSRRLIFRIFETVGVRLQSSIRVCKPDQSSPSASSMQVAACVFNTDDGHRTRAAANTSRHHSRLHDMNVYPRGHICTRHQLPSSFLASGTRSTARAITPWDRSHVILLMTHYVDM